MVPGTEWWTPGSELKLKRRLSARKKCYPRGPKLGSTWAGSHGCTWKLYLSSLSPTFLCEAFHFPRLPCIVARGHISRYNQVCSHVTTQKGLQTSGSVSEEIGGINTVCWLHDWKKGKLVGICSKSDGRKPAKVRIPAKDRNVVW